MFAVRIALKDFKKDAGAFLGLSLALAAILAPLMVLMALKSGVTGALLEELRRDPNILEIQFLSNVSLDEEDFDRIANLPGLGFVARLPRSMGETVEVLTNTNRLTAVTLRSSGAGDPHLGGLRTPEPDEIILSQRSIEDLSVAPGEPLTVVLRYPATGEEFDVALRLLGVSDILPGRFALVHPDVAFAAEAVVRGEAVPALSIPGRPPDSATFDVGRVRIFAKDLRSAAPLANDLRALGYVVNGQWPRIEGVLRLERNLGLLLVVIAILSGLGFAVSFAISIWVNVQRKRKSLAMLRLMGAPSRQVVLFPMVQALCVAGLGLGVAFVLFALVRAQLNRAFADSLPAGAQVAVFPVAEFVIVAAATFLVALCAGAFGGYAVARLEPKEALRDA